MPKVFLFVEISVKAGKADEFITHLEKHAVTVRAEDGCEGLDIFKNRENPDSVCVWEVWRDEAACDVHMENPTRFAWHKVASEYVHGEKITKLKAV